MMNTKSGKLVIFDCDGVLVDSEPIAFAVLREMLAEAGLSFTESWAYENFLGKSMASITAMVAREYNLELDEAALASMRKRLYERFERELEPVHGIAALLASFPFAHCVASSSQIERIELCLTKTGLIGHFEPNIFSASMVARGKPAPDLFLWAAQRMGVGPDRCVVVEDSPHGVAGARAAGMPCIGFAGSVTSRAQLADADLIIDDMTGLAGAIRTLRGASESASVDLPGG